MPPMDLSLRTCRYSNHRIDATLVRWAWSTTARAIASRHHPCRLLRLYILRDDWGRALGLGTFARRGGCASCAYIYIYIDTHVICMYVYIYMYVYVHICMYIYIYIDKIKHIHIHICMYVYILYIYRERESFLKVLVYSDFHSFSRNSLIFKEIH